VSRALILAASLALSACTLPPFERTPPERPTPPAPKPGTSGSGPVLTIPPEVTPVPPGQPPTGIPPPATRVPKERARVPPATLSAPSKALVSQAQAQRRKGDLPGASVSLERALRIEPGNPLLWVEMGRLRMDQRNYPQAESMGRKALSMSVGDGSTQSAAWQLIADSLKARGKNSEAEEAAQKARELRTY
jgi:Flp pilus assembly protein TadD